MKQTELDALAYPPTHTYRLEGLEPTGILARRLEILERIAPGFFRDVPRFLDVAANKGFFTLLAAQACDRVVAVEPEEVFQKLLRRLAPGNVAVVSGIDKLKDPFDRIWIGNAHHYLYREAKGWGWVERLAKLCRGGMLVEGPAGMDCQDMKACIPANLVGDFTRANWIGTLETWFEVLDETPADAYSPGRFVWHCRRREPASFADRVLIPLYRRMAAHVRETDVVLELGVRDDRGRLSRGIFKCAKFIAADRDPRRVEMAGGGVVLDALIDELPKVGVVVSTALLHHTDSESIPLLMKKMCAAAGRMLLVSGPDVKKQPLLYGDHRWHLEAGRLIGLAKESGFELVEHSASGTGDVYLAFGRK